MPGSDLKLSESRTEGYRHFANKIWNASRFALMNLSDLEIEDLTSDPDLSDYSLPDRWIRGRLNQAIQEVRKAIDDYRFNEATHTVYQFIWHEFCDWYLELIKPYLYQKEDLKRRRVTQKNLVEVLDATLRLLHPFMPFITEEIWQNLPSSRKDGSIMVAAFPEADRRFDDDAVSREMELMIEVITSIRNIRGEMNVPPADEVTALLRTRGRETEERLRRNQAFIQNLARVKEVILGENVEKPAYSAFDIVGEVEVMIPMERSRMEEEGKRLQKEIVKINKDIDFVNKKLSNERFLGGAPREVVEEEKEKAAQYRLRRQMLEESLHRIQGALEGKT
jgi:valyl-tRNA synthetase